MKPAVICFAFIVSNQSFSQCIDCGPGSKLHLMKKETRSVAEIYIESLQNNYKPRVFDGVAEPRTLPDLKKNRETLLGIDSNHDGVRDDIEIYINHHFPQDYDREIYKNFFRRGSRFLKLGMKMSQEQAQKETDGFMQDLECSRYISEFGYMKNIEEARNRTFDEYKLMFDTEMRYDIYNTAIKKLKSGGSGVSSGAEAFKFCPKSIQRKYPLKKSKDYRGNQKK